MFVNMAGEERFIASERYRAGEGILLDILDAEVALKEARLNHLSAYVLIGDKAILTSTNPYTYDNIMMWVGLLLVSITGLLIAIKFVSKKRKSEIK